MSILEIPCLYRPTTPNFDITGTLLTPLSAVELARRVIYWSIGFAVLCWILLGLATLTWLMFEVPLEHADYAAMSWLGSPKSALQFTTGTLGGLFMAFIFVTGAMVSVVDGSARGIILAAFSVLVLAFGMGEGAVARISLLDNTVKIGCFVEESRECREMLNLPDNKAESMYASPEWQEKGLPHRQWYWHARSKAVSDQQERYARQDTVPGVALLKAPFYWHRAEELRQKVEWQRAELARVRRAEFIRYHTSPLNHVRHQSAQVKSR